MMAIAYDATEHVFTLARNKGNVAESVKLYESEIRQAIRRTFPDDGAIDALLALAKEVPNTAHVVDNRPRVKARRTYGALVQ